MKYSCSTTEPKPIWTSATTNGSPTRACIADPTSPPVPGGHPPVSKRGGAREHSVRARIAGSVHRSHRRGQDEAHPALREGTPVHRYPARRHRVPVRATHRAEPEGEDLAPIRRENP